MKFITFGLGGSKSDVLRLGLGSGIVLFDPAAVWTHILSNGKSAGQNLVENNTMLLALTGAIEGTLTMFDLLRIIAAVAAGKTRITNLGGGAARVEFDAAGGTDLRVAGEMDGSERTSVDLTP